MARLDEKLARRARVACEKWREYFKSNIDQYHEMHDFVLGQQWTKDEEDTLKTLKKVPLTSNKLGTMANYLLGEQQQNTPQLQVVPMENCDEQTATLREAIVKDIMFNNNSTTVYQVAASQAFIGGFGAYCISTEYSHRKSFDQDIIYHYFKDSTRSYFDVGAEDINKTDGMHAGYISRMTRKKFRSVHGRDIEEKILTTSSITASKEEIALAVQPNIANDPFNWADDESITINDYYERKYVKDTLYKLSNGAIYTQEELDELIEKSRAINEAMQEQQSMMMDRMASGIPGMEQQEEQVPNEINEPLSLPDESDDVMMLWDNGEPVRIEDKREHKRSKIMHYKIAGDYVLDEGEFPAEQLPVVFVDYNSYYDKNGKQICRTFFGDVKDTQRYINYLRTQSAYIIKVSRYDQWIGSKKNVASNDTQRNWRDPVSIQGMLTYDESPTNAKPEQVRPPELSQSLFTQYQLAVEDLYTSTGLYPARMGQQGNEVSGAAVDARTRQGSYSTFVAYNSINRAIATGGSIVNEMIPKVYDAERAITIMMPDDGMKNITVNRQADEYGELIENDIRKGTYQVRLKPGPSFEGQKQEALQSLKEILQVKPEAFDLVADLYADNLPLANNIEIKNRLKTMVPPQIIEAGKTGKPVPQAPQPNPQEQALQQEAMFKQKEMALKEQEIELKKQQVLMDAQFKLQELETQRLETAGKIKEQELRYMAETQRTEQDAAIAHANNLVKILTHKVA